MMILGTTSKFRPGGLALAYGESGGVCDGFLFVEFRANDVDVVALPEPRPAGGIHQRRRLFVERRCLTIVVGRIFE